MKRKLMILCLALLLLALAYGGSGHPVRAASFGSIESICATGGTTLEVTISALGDNNDSGGFDQVGFVANRHAPVWGLIPADGKLHEITLSVVLSVAETQTTIVVTAGDGDGHDHFNRSGFAETEPGVAEPCGDDYYVPAGFVQRTITCNTPVYDDVPGTPVGDNQLKAGQRWYIDPTPIEDENDELWTEVFVNGPNTVYIPTKCVSAS